MKYDLLPPAVVTRYAVRYSELVHDRITIFKNSDGKWGVLKETPTGDFKILVDPVYYSIGFNHVLNYIEAVTYTDDNWMSDKNNYYFYDVNGRLKASVPGVSAVLIDDSGRLLVLKDNCMGLLDNRGETIIVPSYISLYNLQGDLYKAQQGGGYGIIDIQENVLLDFKYKFIFTNVKNNRVIIQDLSDRYFSFHFPSRELHALAYDRIFLATGGGGKPALYKVIRQCEETEFDWFDNGMSEYTGVWGMIHADGTVKIPCEYAFVATFVNPHFFKVAKGKFTFYFDETTGYLTATGVKWGVVDADNNLIVPIEYDWVQEAGENSWVVNKGGRVVFNHDYQNERWEVQGGESEQVN